MADTVNDVLTVLLNKIPNEYDKSEGYFVHDLLKSVSIVLERVGVKIGEVEALIDVEKLTGELLEKFVSQRKGIERTKATYSTGAVTVTGNGLIEIGDIFETKNGVQFQAAENKEIISSGEVKVICLVPGSQGNIPANQIIQIPVTLAGITAVTNANPTAGGYEAETDKSLRERYYIATKTPPTSGNVYHYLQWAKEIPGVGDAKVFPLARGANTVEVVIIDQKKQPGAPELVKKVQDYIDPDSKGLGSGAAPIGAKCYIIPAEGLTLKVAARVTLTAGADKAVVTQKIKDNINNYLESIAFTTNYVSFAKIGESIINTEGVKDYESLTVNGATSNISTKDKQVAILGGVTIE